MVRKLIDPSAFILVVLIVLTLMAIGARPLPVAAEGNLVAAQTYSRMVLFTR